MIAQTLTLGQFLEARIAEDEALADRVALDYPGAGDWESLKERALAECAAKRAIVGIHRDESLDWLPEDEVRDFAEHPEDRPETRCAECSCYGDCVVRIDECRTLRALASVYADHELYRAEWAL